MRAVVSADKPLAGVITPPPSKSHSQRLLAAALMRPGTQTLHGIGASEDEQAAISILRQLNSIVTETGDGTVVIENAGPIALNGYIDCGESGLAARLFTPIAAISALEPVEVRGRGSLLHRPMQEFGSILPRLGVELENFSGHLPFLMRGPLRPGDVRLNGSVSSQYLSGILFTLARVAGEAVRIEVDTPTSLPYIAMTLDVLARFGTPVLHHDFRSFFIDPWLFTEIGEDSIVVEKDWSAAAASLVAGCLREGDEIVLAGLNPQSLQADTAVLHVLHASGAMVLWQDKKLRVGLWPERLRPFAFNCTQCPDLVPVLAILAASREGISRIGGLHRLAHKESDRAATVSEMLAALGVRHTREGDNLLVEGRKRLSSCTIQSHNDHRIVMAAAIAALRADGPVTIEGAEAVRKSYPDFFDDLKHLGITIDLID